MNFSILSLLCDSSLGIHQHQINECCIHFSLIFSSIFSKRSICWFHLQKLHLLVLIHAPKHFHRLSFLLHLYKKSNSIIFILVKTKTERRIWSCWFWSTNRYCQLLKTSPQLRTPKMTSDDFFFFLMKFQSHCVLLMHNQLQEQDRDIYCLLKSLKKTVNIPFFSLS